jgi:hypothetical protein
MGKDSLGYFFSCMGNTTQIHRSSPTLSTLATRPTNPNRGGPANDEFSANAFEHTCANLSQPLVPAFC